MSREIKFRAWDGEVQSMIYDKDPGWVLRKAKDMHDWKVMQYTGLTDKNGVEIYELCELNNRYIVTYVAPRFCLYEISSGDIMELDEQLTYTITTEYKPLPQNTKGSAD